MRDLAIATPTLSHGHKRMYNQGINGEEESREPTQVLVEKLPLKRRVSVCMHVGSPLQYTVGKTPIGGTHKVEFGGPGAERGAIGVKSKFVVCSAAFSLSAARNVSNDPKVRRPRSQGRRAGGGLGLRCLSAHLVGLSQKLRCCNVAICIIIISK